MSHQHGLQLFLFVIPIIGVELLNRCFNKVGSDGKSGEIDDNNTRVVKLLESESNDLMMAIPGIATVTFYKGQPPMKFLRNRVAEIVAVNPWIFGNLKKINGSIHLTYSTMPRSPSNVIGLSKDLAFQDSLSFDDICKKVKPFIVDSGAKCMNAGSPLLKINIVVTGDNSFALIFSVNHVIADGHTFYELYNMLSFTSRPRPLIVERQHNFMQKLDAAVIRGGNDTFGWFFSPGPMCNIVYHMVFGAKIESHLAVVNNHAIEEVKEQFKQERVNRDNRASDSVSFLSTNDILASFFMSAVKCDVGLMAANFRGRMEGVTNDHAGNYEALISYQPQDYATPQLIRQSLIQGYRRAVSGSLPGFFRSLTARISVLTNWATFYCDVYFPNCAQTTHMPYVNTEDFTAFGDVGILFRQDAHTTALCFMGQGSAKPVLQQSTLFSGK